MGEKPKLAISFSGGRTSGYMLFRCLKVYDSTHDIVIAFANTGCEHEATLEFVHQCNEAMGRRIVWLEAVIHPEDGKGVTHRLVTFETASRNGEPFEAYIAKYGIPNRTCPSCTDRLKSDVIRSYLKSIGWNNGKKRDYKIAIGIRADEMDRVSSRKDELGFVYPLIDEGVRKSDVIAFWEKQPFDLKIPGDHYGNCVWCWKKADRKLFTLSIEAPEVFVFPERMDRKYGTFKADCAAGKDGIRTFFRKYRTTAAILSEAHERKFVPYSDEFVRDLIQNFDPDLDVGSACGESCEIGADMDQ